MTDPVFFDACEDGSANEAGRSKRTLSAEARQIELDTMISAKSLGHELTPFGPDPSSPAIRYARCRRDCGLDLPYSIDERFHVDDPRRLHSWSLSAARMSRCGMR